MAALSAALGYADPLLVAAEPFHLWVIEGPAAIAAEFPLRQAGLDVVWTTDLAPYRTRKVRILNGAHTATSLAAFSAGLDTVKAMTEDPVVAKFLARVMFDEIVPFVPAGHRAARVRRDDHGRFGNPISATAHLHRSSISKWRSACCRRRDFAAARGKAPPNAFSLAAAGFSTASPRPAAARRHAQRRVLPDQGQRRQLAIVHAAWRDLADPAKVATALADTGLWDGISRAGPRRSVATSLARIRRAASKLRWPGCSRSLRLRRRTSLFGRRRRWRVRVRFAHRRSGTGANATGRQSPVVRG
jgi:tagaturonate reductase